MLTTASALSLWQDHPWISASIITIVLYGVAMFFKHVWPRILARRVPSLRIGFYDVIKPALARTKSWMVLFLSFSVAARMTQVHKEFPSFIYNLAVVVLFIQIILWIFAIIDAQVHGYMRRTEPGNSSILTSVGIVSALGKTVVFILAALVAMDVMGINVTALVAGVGIGGIAIAFAVQGLLQDLFASLTIVFDRPFRVGQSIAYGTIMGTVERVGLKTTRVRSVNGELLIVPNAQLLSNQISNYAELKERRCFATLGVTYDTPVEKMEKIAGWLQDIVSNTESCRFDRAHFRNFGPSSLDVELVYFVQIGALAGYLDKVQHINLAIMRKFESEGLSFAFPTQTVHVTQSSAD